MKKTIAISMRVIQHQNGVWSDSLSQDWPIFLRALLPNWNWLPFPNIGDLAADMAKGLGVNGLILSGGENWGEYPLRDSTEKSLYLWAKKNAFPILGVSRGMNVISRFSGLLPSSLIGHVATRHRVSFFSGQEFMVNSFHNYGITQSTFEDITTMDNNINYDSEFKPLAICEDGSIEALRHDILPILGMMWHPEREEVPIEHDKLLIQQLFGW